MTTVEDILEHFGTKGMKWGVRKDRGHEGEQVKTSKLPKLDKKWEQTQGSFGTYIAVHNRAAELTNKNDVARINNKPEYKDADFSRPSELRTKYYAEHQRAFIDNVVKAATERGMNPSGTKNLGVHADDDGNWVLTLNDVKHDDQILGVVKLTKDSKGHILSMKVVPNAMTHGAFIAEDVLAHFGVKGMKWGVRRTRSASGKLEPAEVHVNPIGQVHKVTGGTNHPTSEDAKRAMALRQVAKASGTHALSNDEMRDLLNRMNLEENYGRLTDSQSGRAKIKKGHTAVKEIVAVGKTVAEINSLARKAQRKG